MPAAVRQEVRRQWDALGPEAMHARLAAVDPAYAARIAPADRQRVTRALEVQAATGRPFGQWHALPDPEAPDYATLSLGVALPLDAPDPAPGRAHRGHAGRRGRCRRCAGPC